MERNAIEEFDKDKHLGWPSFTPTVIRAPFEGEAQLNVMPGETRLFADIRTVPGQSHAEIRRAIVQMANPVTGKVKEHYRKYEAHLNLMCNTQLNIKTKFVTDHPCTFTDNNDPVVNATDWATCRITAKASV